MPRVKVHVLKPWRCDGWWDESEGENRDAATVIDQLIGCLSRAA
jgi:hypothetical protein